jgi:hypothetical protein
MFLEIVFPSETGATDVTTKSLLSRMDNCVCLQMSSLSKTLTTNAAYIRFLTSMSSYMNFQGVLLSKTYTTEITAERVFSCVKQCKRH